jgi:acyl-CoA dehydrogenase
MSDRLALRQTVDRLMRENCPPEVVRAAEGSWAPDLWRLLEVSDLVTVSVDESAGGAGGDLGDAAVVITAVSRRAGPVPLVETGLLAGWLCESAEMPLAAGPYAVAVADRGGDAWVEEDGDGLRLHGVVRRVPWAHVCENLLLVAPTGSRTAVVQVDPGSCDVRRGQNLAGEPRDDVTVDGIRVPSSAWVAVDVDIEEVRRRGALGRTLQMSAALESVLALSVRYAGEREQFGRPIARFQAIQHLLAQLAGETAGAVAAAHGAVREMSSGNGRFAVAAAKVRVGAAAGRGAAIAHQVHGAIGVTREHELHLHTRRLWSWRDEFGNEAWWAAQVAEQLRQAGPEGLWPLVAGGSGRSNGGLQ